MRVLFPLVIGMMLMASGVFAQTTIVNPTKIEVPASADHGTTFGSTPILSKYETLVVRQTDTGTVLQVVDNGKPTPNASNILTLAMPTGLPNNVLLQVAVRASGPGGATTSVLSDPFGVVGPPAAPGKPVPKP